MKASYKSFEKTAAVRKRRALEMGVEGDGCNVGGRIAGQEQAKTVATFACITSDVVIASLHCASLHCTYRRVRLKRKACRAIVTAVAPY